MALIKYSKTPLFRNLIQEVRLKHDYVGRDQNDDPVYEHTTPYPKIKFEVSVKIHGTNAGIVLRKNQPIQYQSRESILTLEEDNSSFMRLMSQKDLSFITNHIGSYETIAVYGEWCGKGIQKGTAVNQLDDKYFVIFYVTVDGESVSFKDIKDHEQKIYNVYDFQTWNVEIDFNDPSKMVEELTEITHLVEKECPVGKYFGISGIGEGIVLRSIEDRKMTFKSKGEKHSVVKSKTPIEVDPVKLSNINDFIDYTVTDNRLNQGLEHYSLDMKNIGNYIKWVINDITSEEMSTLDASGLTLKDVSKSISNKARTFFIDKFNNDLGV